MKKFSSFINLKDLVTNVVAATIILTLIACGGGNMLPGIITGTSSRVAHLIHLPNSGHRIAPNTGKPFLAAMFAVPANPSQLAQSYDLQCTSFSYPPSIPVGDLMPIPGTFQVSQPSSCNNEVPTPLPQIDGQGGKATFFDGSLSDLIVTGKTASGVAFQCRDITNTMAVVDNSITQPYLDSNSHQVKIFNQPVPNGAITQAPFICNGIGTDTDPVASIEVQFAKQ